MPFDTGRPQQQLWTHAADGAVVLTNQPVSGPTQAGFRQLGAAHSDMPQHTSDTVAAAPIYAFVGNASVASVPGCEHLSPGRAATAVAAQHSISEALNSAAPWDRASAQHPTGLSAVGSPHSLESPTIPPAAVQAGLQRLAAPLAFGPGSGPNQPPNGILDEASLFPWTVPDMDTRFLEMPTSQEASYNFEIPHVTFGAPPPDASVPP